MYKIIIKFDKDPLGVEQNNYASKIVNVYIAYDLDTWLRDPTSNFKFKDCFFGATSVAKNIDKEKFMYSGDSWSFDIAKNDIAKNVIIFGVENISSSRADKCKNNFLVQVKIQLSELMKDLVHQREGLVLILIKKTQKFAWVYINADNGYLFVNGKEIFKFKADNKNVNFLTQFCLWSIPNGFSDIESIEASLNGDVYDFSVNYNFIDKSDILNIHKYLMNKNSIK